MKLGNITQLRKHRPNALFNIRRLHVYFANGIVSGFGLHKFPNSLYLVVGKYALCFKMKNPVIVVK